MKSLLVPLFVVAFAQAASAQKILVKPYVQPGDGVTLEGHDVKAIAWLTDQTPGNFTVEFGLKDAMTRTAQPHRVQLDFKPAPPATPKATPRATPAPAASDLADAATTLEELKSAADKEASPPIPEKEQHYFKYAATLTELPFDAEVFYRVKLGAQLVREGSFKTRATADKPIRFAAVGDLANGKPEQNGVAWQIAQAKPDFLIALGDIVYSSGRVSQYMHHFWTTYNQPEQPGPDTGAPLMQSVPVYPVIGNHDADVAKLPVTPDALGAFYFFHGPLNGPGLGKWNTPLGKDAKVAAKFRADVGPIYPALNVYSFDYGPAHFVMLDTNSYTSASLDLLKPWIEKDLRGAKARWKFVCFHAPAFHTSKEHFTEQKMRLFEPIFEAAGVDVVLAGHVHNYQRSKPLRFTPNPPKRDPRGRVNGDFQLDEQFDGVKNTRPNGVIHIVSGGGGAKLYSVDFAKTVAQLQKDHPGNWVPFTAKYVAAHSFSLIDVTPTQFTLRQIDIKGVEIDRVTITK